MDADLVRNGERLKSCKEKTALELEEGKLWYSVDVPILLDYIKELEECHKLAGKVAIALDELMQSEGNEPRKDDELSVEAWNQARTVLNKWRKK